MADSGTLLGALGALLGCSWGALGRTWALLGRSWGALGPLLESSWALLGAPGRPLGDLGSIFDPQRVDFGASGDGFSTLQGSIVVRVGDDLRVVCERLAADFQETCERFVSELRETGELDGLTASIEEATMEGSSDTAPQCHSSDSSIIYSI